MTDFSTAHLNIIFRSDLIQCFLEIHGYLKTDASEEATHMDYSTENSDPPTLRKSLGAKEARGILFSKWPPDRMCWMGVKLINHIFSILNSNARDFPSLANLVHAVVADTLSHFKNLESLLHRPDPGHSVTKGWYPVFEDPQPPGKASHFTAPTLSYRLSQNHAQSFASLLLMLWLPRSFRLSNYHFGSAAPTLLELS